MNNQIITIRTLLALLLFSVTTNVLNAEQKVGISEWYKVEKNTYVFRYTYYYSMFVKTSKGIIVFDPISNDAAQHYVSAIREALPKTALRAIVYTHWHTDHATGANVLLREFGENIPIIAHQRTLKRLEESDYPDIPLPTIIVSDDGLVLDDDVNPVELRYIGYAHTNTMLIAYLTKQKLIFAVDFVNHDSMGWRDLPGVDVDELVAMQRNLLDTEFTKITFGHGKPGDRNVVKRQIKYYQTLLDKAQDGIKKGLSEDQLVKTVNLPQYQHWGNYDRWFKLNVRGTYRWVKQRGIK